MPTSGSWCEALWLVLRAVCSRSAWHLVSLNCPFAPCLNFLLVSVDADRCCPGSCSVPPRGSLCRRWDWGGGPARGAVGGRWALRVCRGVGTWDCTRPEGPVGTTGGWCGPTAPPGKQSQSRDQDPPPWPAAWGRAGLQPPSSPHKTPGTCCGAWHPPLSKGPSAVPAGSLQRQRSGRAHGQRCRLDSADSTPRRLGVAQEVLTCPRRRTPPPRRTEPGVHAAMVGPWPCWPYPHMWAVRGAGRPKGGGVCARTPGPGRAPQLVFQAGQGVPGCCSQDEAGPALHGAAARGDWLVHGRGARSLPGGHWAMAGTAPLGKKPALAHPFQGLQHPVAFSKKRIEKKIHPPGQSLGARMTPVVLGWQLSGHGHPGGCAPCPSWVCASLCPWASAPCPVQHITPARAGAARGERCDLAQGSVLFSGGRAWSSTRRAPGAHIPARPPAWRLASMSLWKEFIVLELKLLTVI